LNRNLFLFGKTAVDRVVEVANTTVGEGRGIAALLGTLTMLLPFGLIDTAANAPRSSRWALWCTAILLLFYQLTSSRGLVLLGIMAILLSRTSNWRQILFAGSLALAAFSVASVIRGDSGNGENPLLEGITTPYVNLFLLSSSHCGTAPWYDFIFEFFKKFLPSFIFPKTIFSFNVRMSQCIYPTADENIASISIFTWLGELIYYQPSILTALTSGVLMGGMAWIVDRRLVKLQLHSSRLYAGFMCVMILRSRVLDLMSILIAQFIFLLIFPLMTGLARSLRFLSAPADHAAVQPGSDGGVCG